VYTHDKYLYDLNLLHMSKQKTIFSIALIIVLVVLVLILSNLRTVKAPVATSTTTSPTAERGLADALARLQTDLRGVTPHIIGTNKMGEQSLTSVEQRIKDDVVAVRDVRDPTSHEYNANIILQAVGLHYIVFHQLTTHPDSDIILNTADGTETPIDGNVSYGLTSLGRNAILYIGYKAVYLYTPDQASAVLVTGSQLSGNETYHSGEGDFSLIVHEKHTKNSITVAVFDESQQVHNPDAVPGAMDTMNKQLREDTMRF